MNTHIYSKTDPWIHFSIAQSFSEYIFWLSKCPMNVFFNRKKETWRHFGIENTFHVCMFGGWTFLRGLGTKGDKIQWMQMAQRALEKICKVFVNANGISHILNHFDTVKPKFGRLQIGKFGYRFSHILTQLQIGKYQDTAEEAHSYVLLIFFGTDFHRTTPSPSSERASVSIHGRGRSCVILLAHSLGSNWTLERWDGRTWIPFLDSFIFALYSANISCWFDMIWQCWSCHSQSKPPISLVKPTASRTFGQRCPAAPVTGLCAPENQESLRMRSETIS